MIKTAHHICIYGRVQGVGFRPKVYQLAQKNQLKGWVINNSAGVRIHCEANEEETLKFRDTLTCMLLIILYFIKQVLMVQINH